MYEMEGALPGCAALGRQLPGCPVPRAARQGQTPARDIGFPVSPTFRGRPRAVPVSNGEVFLSLLRAPRKSPRLIISLFLDVHNLSTEYGQFSARRDHLSTA